MLFAVRIPSGIQLIIRLVPLWRSIGESLIFWFEIPDSTSPDASPLGMLRKETGRDDICNWEILGNLQSQDLLFDVILLTIFCSRNVCPIFLLYSLSPFLRIRFWLIEVAETSLEVVPLYFKRFSLSCVN